jgi:hypothetical protein
MKIGMQLRPEILADEALEESRLADEWASILSGSST